MQNLSGQKRENRRMLDLGKKRRPHDILAYTVVALLKTITISEARQVDTANVVLCWSGTPSGSNLTYLSEADGDFQI